MTVRKIPHSDCTRRDLSRVDANAITKFRVVFRREELAFQNRSALRAMGLNPDDYLGKPVIGIASSNDLNNCNGTASVAAPKGCAAGRRFAAEFHHLAG